MILEHKLLKDVHSQSKKTAGYQGGLGGQSGWADSNRRPPRPKRGALPAALHPERREYTGNGDARQAGEYDIIFPLEKA